MNDTINPDALPYAVPKSALPGVVWPAIPDDAASNALALQFQLEQSQWWPPEVIEARQFEQLQRVLEHARRTVPFYAERLAGVDLSVPFSREAWSRIPITTRRDVQLNTDALRSGAVPPGHGALREVTTSGSIGRAVTIQTTQVYSYIWQAITLRDHFWHRRDLGAKFAIIRSVTPGLANYPDGLASPAWGPPADVVYATGPSAMVNTACSIAEQAEWLTRQDPDYLLTSATRAREIALHFRRHGLRLTRLREVRTIAEAHAADLRALCREVWGAPVIDMYSSEEVGYLALQCPEGEHYHVQAENVLLEVLDDHGRPCRAGEVGRVVVSTLHNYATPLIRYEIGDYAEAGGACPCGRGLPVLTRILGRVRNMLRMPDGSRRWPNFMLAKVYKDLPDAQIQIVQPAADTIELRVVPEHPLSPADEARLVDYVHDWAGPGFRVDVRVVESIPRGPGGKFEEFMSLIDPVP